ncbi:MAG TPA: outer membrane beta-barrel family protein, partial [Anditalea sp.]|nr:outer membrane beta-barrel family protein [Anditalea sp.]
MRHILFLICSCIAVSALGQNISGKILGPDSKPVVFANVLLLQPTDSALVKGTISDAEGIYRFDNVPEGNFLLSGYMMGYKRNYLPIAIKKGDIDAPLISLIEEVGILEEVVVETKRPLVEQDNYKTVVNVANSIIATGSTALEVLEKAPGVRVDRQNDGISLMGREQVIVQINGKQTYLSMSDVVALLRNMPSDNIDKIELVTNPTAKYDAEGNSGVINIVLQKNNNLGTNGSVSLTGGSGRYLRTNGSFQINHRTNKFNFFGNASALQNRFYWDFDLLRDQADGELRNIVTQLSYIRFLDKGQNAKAGVDYFLDDNTTIGIVWTGFGLNRFEDSPAHTAFRRSHESPVYFQQLTQKELSVQSQNHVANLNIQHNFKSHGAVLNVDFDLGFFRRQFTNDLITSTLIPHGVEGLEALFTAMPTLIDIKTFKFDYSREVFGSWKMETGYKISNVQSDNNMSLRRGDIENVQLDPELSNHFRYLERINALYVSFNGKLFLETDLQLGLRAEHTYSLGESLNLGQRVPRDYLNLFPTVFISRKIMSNQTLGFSYGYRIDRPNYQSLNPGRSYLDPYAFSRGNPYLNPQYTHALELKHSFDSKIFTSIGANYISDYMIPILQPVDERSAERVMENFGTAQFYNANMSFPVTIHENWNLQANILGAYRRFQFIFLGNPLSTEQISGRFNGVNTFTLGKGWSAEMT